MKNDLFRDPELGMELVAMAVWNRGWLRRCGDRVSPQDWVYRNDNGRSFSPLIAEIALDFWKRYREPIGSLLVPELQKKVRQLQMGAEKKQALEKWLKELKERYRAGRSEALQEAVWQWKRQRARQKALQEMVALEEEGKLTDQEWLNILRQAIEGADDPRILATDWMAEVDQRIERRSLRDIKRVPALLIDPLDQLVPAIGRGQIGLWLAQYKMGKSLALIWTAVVYMMQRLNVLLITLEDPKSDVEDRLDACVSHIPIEELMLEGEQVQEKIDQLRGYRDSRIRIVDGTESSLTVGEIDGIWERERAMGFEADAIIIDYDDEIRPAQKRPERRFEFADIYRDLRKLAAKREVFLWTAAQTRRMKKEEGDSAKVVRADSVAEDISKIRKVTMAIGIGEGAYGDESRYLNIAAHKNARQNIGCNICSAPAKSLFFDRDRTLQWMARDPKLKKG